MVINVTNFQGINTFTNPMALQDGQILQAVNVTQTPFGAYTKRGGYDLYLGSPDNNQVNTMFTWYRQDGSFNNYRASGSILYYSIQGTGNWTACGNGTISNNAFVGHATLNDVLIIGDGVGSTRHSTDGTSFTNTTDAPISPFFEAFQQRIYALGTGASFNYSSANDATNWSVGGTSDSASFVVGGEGSISYLFKNSDRMFFIMSGRHEMYQWDGFNLVDLVNDIGPTSPRTFDQTENLAFWLNRQGIFTYSGASPQIISNPIQRLTTSIVGNNYGTASGATHLYDYFAAVGTISDDFTNGTVSNAVLKYDIRQNDWSVYTFANPPTAFLSYVDINNAKSFLFGDNNGQCYVFDGSSTDNGTPIQSILEFLIIGGTLKEKLFYNLRMLMNPGCEAQIEVAITNNLSSRAKKYVSVGQAIDGVVDYRISSSMARGRFMFVKISDNTVTNGFQLYGAEVALDIVKNVHD